jgi:ribonucleoside-diphosphate reductase beta chain
MQSNHWTEEDIDFSGDPSDWLKLSEEERRSYKFVTGFLVFLDSINTYNPSLLSMHITAPEVNVLFALQTKEEAIHSKSYGTQIETIIPYEEREEIYQLWREDGELLSRINFIVSHFTEYNDHILDKGIEQDKRFFKAMVAMYVLEGLYFYMGFLFFYNLSYNGKMNGTADNIRHISKDERTHLVLSINILKTLKEENPEVYDEKFIVDMMAQAVETEIKWSVYALKGVLGFDPNSISQYVKTLANRRLKALDIANLYEGVSNPYRNIEVLQDSLDKADGSNETGMVKGNFFTTTVTSYQRESYLDGIKELSISDLED